VLYVYALAETSEAALPALRGHRGAQLRHLSRNGVTAVFSRHRQIELPPEPDHLWRHERITEALMADRGVLPVRFGTTVADEAALATMLTARAEEFRELLALVRRRVEIGVRALWTSPAKEPSPAEADPAGPAGPVGPAGPGRAYLLDALRARHAPSRVADTIHAALAEHAVSARRRVLVTPRLLLSGAYLLERDGVDRFLAVADEVDRAHSEVELVCTGPWPPHSFAAGTPEAR
jgi:gas vesicle protein GvpL/GvpF